MAGILLTSEQIDAGTGSLVNDATLSASQVGDLVSIFRGYLGELADNYSLESTFTAENDSLSGGLKRCAKLAACLDLFSENQFTPDVAGFAPTAANRTGFVYQLEGENFKVFQYAFGLFWTLPKSLSGAGTGSRRTSAQGVFVRTSL